MSEQNRHVVGIDVSKKKLDVTLLKAEGGKRRKKIANNTAGIAALDEWLQKQVQGDVHICMESTSVYWEELAETMAEKAYTVSVVNPLRIKGYAISQLRRSKTDPIDGDVIADFCQTQKPTAWTPPTAQQKKLRALVRHLEALKKGYRQQHNRLETCRDEDVRGSLATILAAIEAEIQQVQEQIEQLIDQDPDLKEKRNLLVSIKGIGETTANLILAEMYDLDQYDNAKAAAADVGVTTSHYRSGSSVNRRPRISRLGKATVRSALYFPAISAIQYNPLVRKLAQRLKARGKHKAAIRVAAMRKLIHLAFGVLKHRMPFDPAYAS